MPASRRAVGSASTTRLRKLECPVCGCVARQSRSWMVRGLLVCSCGARMIPDALEDAIACHAAGVLSDVELEQHPERVLLERAANSAAHGQAFRGGLHAAGHRGWDSPDVKAAAVLERDRRERAVANRLNALSEHNPRRRPVAPMPF